MNKKYASLSLVLLLTFLLWTAAVTAIDIRPIGPNGSLVGLAGLNGFVHRLTGVHMALYVLTDWLSLIPVLVILFFAWLVKTLFHVPLMLPAGLQKPRKIPEPAAEKMNK